MKELFEYLPLLNLLVVPVWIAYTKNEVRMSRLEDHKGRVEHHLGWVGNQRKDHGENH